MNSKIKLSAFVLLATSSLASVGCKNTSNLFFTVNGKDLEVVFCDRGASIYSIKYKNNYITYHPKKQSDFLKDDYYYGKCLGRVAGRIKDGKISVGEKDYQLEVNETSGKKHNSIHGGTHGLATKDFKRYTNETNDAISVVFNYVSSAGEAGYPEILNTTYTYTVSKIEPKIDIDITASSSGETPVNLSNHPYFRLGNSGNILDHVLTITADNMARFDVNAGDQLVQESVAISTISPAYDFSTAKRIGKDIQTAKAQDPVSGGYDHIWHFGNNKSFGVNLYNPSNKINLKVDSDADAVICYANCYPHEGLEINPGHEDVMNGGITIEPIKFFTKDRVSDLNIRPDAPFTRHISYTLSEK